MSGYSHMVDAKNDNKYHIHIYEIKERSGMTLSNFAGHSSTMYLSSLTSLEGS